MDNLAAAHDTLNAMLALAEQVRADRQITDIVNIGIGGSHLGPEVVVQGLEDWVDAGKRVHFVSNVDGHELGHVLRQVRPESTLFLIASKSFTTAETMLNAHSAREWFLRQGGCVQPSAAVSIAQHFVALTTNVAAAQAFGITRCLEFSDWVGGRFSLWSAIGLPIAIAIGQEQFRDLFGRGARHGCALFRCPHWAQFAVAPGAAGHLVPQFLPFGQPLHCPYSHGLRRLAAYLQQLEMESNGKRVTHAGQCLTTPTAPIVWASRAPMASTPFFSCCTRGRMWCPWNLLWPGAAANTWGRTSTAWSSTPSPRPRR